MAMRKEELRKFSLDVACRAAGQATVDAAWLIREAERISDYIEYGDGVPEGPPQPNES